METTCVGVAAVRRPDPAADPVGWALFVNARWPVRNGLAAAASAYLESLSADRRDRACRIAAAMDRVRRRLGTALDPKPFFYGGLFALADDDEVVLHLDSHRFTRALVRRGDLEVRAWLASVSPSTRALFDQVHALLREVLSQDYGDPPVLGRSPGA